jgi:DNA mismatch endonuclease (patch repair protein)
MDSSNCCRLPKTNKEFWVKKITRNKERDKEEQKKLASMGWHCITIWECGLKPRLREQTLDSLAFTLNHIYLQDRQRSTVYLDPKEKCLMDADRLG